MKHTPVSRMQMVLALLGLGTRFNLDGLARKLARGVNIHASSPTHRSQPKLRRLRRQMGSRCKMTVRTRR